MLAGTPKPIGPAQFEAYASRVENERLKEVADAPVSGLKMDTAGNSYYAWSDEAKKLSEHRKSVDELRDTSAAWAATPTTPAPDVQLGNGRVVTPPVGAVVVSGGVLSFNGGTLDAGFVNGPGAAQLLPKPPASGISSGEAFLPKAKEAKDGLRQEAQAADKSERSGHYQVMNDVLVSAASEAKPTGEKVVRGLAADDWANDAVAPAAAPVDLGFGGAATQPAFGLDMASTIKSPMILKGIAKGYGGRFGHAGLGRGGRVTDAEAETDGEHKEAASHELRAYDVRKKDLVALGDVSKLTGKDTDGDSIITAAGGGELGRFSKRERALEETEKTRRLNVLVTDTDEKAKAEDEKQSLERHATRERLAKTTIPNIDFKQANIQDVAQFISQTKSADGTDAGLKIEVDPSVAEVPPITMTLKRVNALDTVKYVSDIAGLSYHIDGDKVVITSRGVDASRVVTRAFDINSSLIESITKKTGAEQSAELQTFFTSAGMSFPQGASVAYDATKQKLIVSNTPENVEKVEGLTATLDAKVAAKPTEPVTKPIFRAAGVNPWMAVSDQSFSTVSISVDSAAFTLARRYLNGGQRPPPESVRTEEFVNYLDYAYAPPGRDLFSVHAAFARTPFCPPGVQLLKLGIKGRQFGREDRGANLTCATAWRWSPSAAARGSCWISRRPRSKKRFSPRSIASRPRALRTSKPA
ncbi:MAG: von Willebrand factor type A domain-containing protein [Kiritimatiellaeota bacterium]|nr:von Willebrand factor type A domain-containing protein [Kiritimatiellota bacterium]